MAVGFRLTAACSLTFLLATCGWAQAVDNQDANSAGEHSRDRSVPALPPPPLGDWRRSPFVEQPYVPLGLKHKAYLFGYRNVDPSSFAKSAVTAGLAQWRNKPSEWGQGMEGYGKRYGHRLANRGAESVIGFTVAAVFHQDARYFRNPTGTIRHRLWHSVSQTFVTRTDGGGKTFSAWRFAGNYGGQFVTNAWRPERQTGVGDTMLRGTISIGYDAASNVFKEFWPDIRKRIFKR
jgi:hypothetical protein